MGVIGMLMSEQHAIKPVHLCVEQLLAQIGRAVDQNACYAARASALNQQRAAPPAVFWIVRIARAPTERDARHAHGRPAAQDGEGQTHAASRKVRGTLRNSRKKFSVVWRAISSGDTPRVCARTFAVSTT